MVDGLLVVLLYGHLLGTIFISGDLATLTEEAF